jgi:N12 class adenine-specific DNA methylase
MPDSIPANFFAPESYTPDDIRDLVTSTARKYGVDPNLALRIANTESNLSATAVSPQGAIGPMQLMPGTAKSMGADPYDPVENVDAGVRYFNALMTRYGGNADKALAAYNAGPGRVASGQPLPTETQNYVQKTTPGIPANFFNQPDSASGQGADQGIPADFFKDPADYNTPIPRARQAEYNAWKKQYAPNDTGGDYDFQGAFLAGQTPAGNGRFPDQFQKPNHPTFSDESQYSGQNGQVGGHWVEQGGQTFFFASPTNLENHSAQELKEYFHEREPGATLVLPGDAPTAASIQAKQAWLHSEGDALAAQAKQLEADRQSYEQDVANRAPYLVPPYTQPDQIDEVNQRAEALQKQQDAFHQRVAGFNDLQQGFHLDVTRYNAEVTRDNLAQQVAGKLPVPGMGGLPAPPGRLVDTSRAGHMPGHIGGFPLHSDEAQFQALVKAGERVMDQTGAEPGNWMGDMPWHGAVSGSKGLMDVGPVAQDLLTTSSPGRTHPQPIPEADLRQGSQGLSELIGGGLEAIAPLAIPDAVANPLSVGLKIGSGSAADKATQYELEKAGWAPQYAGLAAMAAGFLVPGLIEGYERFGDALNAHHEAAGRLLETERLEGLRREAQAERAVDMFEGEHYPLRITLPNGTPEGEPRSIEVRFQGASPETGVGIWQVVGEDGKPLYTGSGGAVRSWLSTHQVEMRAPGQEEMAASAASHVAGPDFLLDQIFGTARDQTQNAAEQLSDQRAGIQSRLDQFGLPFSAPVPGEGNVLVTGRAIPWVRQGTGTEYGTEPAAANAGQPRRPLAGNAFNDERAAAYESFLEPRDTSPAPKVPGTLEIALRDIGTRYKQIRDAERHLESGQDVQMSSGTMRGTTPDDRIQMLRDAVDYERQRYEEEWQQLAQGIGARRAQALRHYLETAEQAAQAAHEAETPVEAAPARPIDTRPFKNAVDPQLRAAYEAYERAGQPVPEALRQRVREQLDVFRDKGEYLARQMARALREVRDFPEGPYRVQARADAAFYSRELSSLVERIGPESEPAPPGASRTQSTAEPTEPAGPTPAEPTQPAGPTPAEPAAAGPTPPGRAQTTPAAETPVAGVKPGAEIPLRVGDAKVKAVQDGRVIFDHVGPGGQKSEMNLGVQDFLSLMKNPPVLAKPAPPGPAAGSQGTPPPAAPAAPAPPSSTGALMSQYMPAAAAISQDTGQVSAPVVSPADTAQTSAPAAPTPENATEPRAPETPEKSNGVSTPAATEEPGTAPDLAARMDAHNAKAQELMEQAKKLGPQDRAPLLDQAMAETRQAARLRKQLEAAQKTQKLPAGLPDAVREGHRFVDPRVEGRPTVATISLTGNIELQAPYDQLQGADRHTLLGALEGKLKNPQTGPQSPDRPPVALPTPAESDLDPEILAGANALLDERLGARKPAQPATRKSRKGGRELLRPVEEQKKAEQEARAAGQAARDRLRARRGTRTGENQPQFQRDPGHPAPGHNIPKEDLMDLAAIGAEHMIAHHATTWSDWETAMRGDVGDVIDQIAQEAGHAPDLVLRTVHQYARALARQHGVTAEATPPVPPAPEPLPTAAPEKTIEGEGGHGGDTGERGETAGPGESLRPQGSEALEGIPAQNVSRPGEGEPSLPGSPDSSHPNAGTHAGADHGTAGAPVRSGDGDRIPTVVSPAGRKGSAEPDIRSGKPPDVSGDFRLTSAQAALLESSGAKTKARNNLEAIRVVKRLLAENRPPTAGELEALARYVGWGQSELAQGMFTGYKSEWAGLREELKDLLTPAELKAARESTINAHYTRRDLAAEMWNLARQLGFRAGGTVLEAGMGNGNFFMMQPEDLIPATSRTGVEMDLLTGAMAKALFPGSNILVKPFQEANLPDGYFDVMIGNVPFAHTQVVDPAYQKRPFLTANVHNYFIGKGMDKLRAGGVMVVITSRFTMDAKETAFRRWLNEQAELVGAVRLPNDTFSANAGTSVTTDILILRKRIPGGMSIAQTEGRQENAWVESKILHTADGFPVDVNEYFHAHPEMMMGEMRGRTQYYRGFPELSGTFSLDKLRELFQGLPSNVLPSWDTQPSGSRDELIENYPDAQFVKEGQYALVNGALVQREGAYFRPVNLTGKKRERMRGLIGIRGAAREVVRTQWLDMPENVIVAARQQLNQLYDAFVKEHGPIHGIGNALVFADDPDWPVLTGLLEDYEPQDWRNIPQAAKEASRLKTGSGKAHFVVLPTGGVELVHGRDRYHVATKRPIFRERTILKPARIEHVDTAAEALAVSLNELGRLDWDRMQELTGRTPAEMQRELAGRIFRDPISKQWETQDEYLSGNVRQKLKDAEFAVRDHPELAGNVEALRAVQPPWKPAGKITANIGATWIPDTDYADFLVEVLHAERHDRHGVTLVQYVPETGAFATRENPGFSDNGVANTTEYGTPYFSGFDLFDLAINGRMPVARDYWEDADGHEHSAKNADATIAAVEKQTKLSDRFAEWLWSNPERAQRLETKFNEEHNNLRLREYDGSHLTFPGLNRSWLRNQDPDAHQKTVVWRTLQSGNTLYAHVVGAGKTLEAIMAAMELRRLGMARKPMIAVPNHLVGQWRDQWLLAYPGAQILVPTKKDFEKQNRQRLMARIASGNYDAVIVGHQGLGKLPVKDATFQEFIDEQLKQINDAIEAASIGKSEDDARRNDAIEAASIGKSEDDARRNPTIKNLIRRKNSLEAKLEKRLHRENKDTGLAFEELGVDWLFVDEADLFKNLGYTTQMDRIAGLPNSDSDRATDLLLKTRFLSKLHGGQRGVVFLTGTPVSNSIAEIWTMMRYLMPEYLEQQGFDQFDAWAKTFGKIRSQMEIAPEGNRFIQRNRFAKFQNAGQMMNMFRLVADIRTANQLNLPTPAVLTGGYIDVVAPASEALKEYVHEIGERADRIRAGKVKPEDDNMLKISSDGRKASLDLRLMRPTMQVEVPPPEQGVPGNHWALKDFTPVAWADPQTGERKVGWALGHFHGGPEDPVKLGAFPDQALPPGYQIPRGQILQVFQSVARPDDPHSKVNKAVANVLAVYQEFAADKAAQLIFLDLSTPKSEKVKKTKPASQVANTQVANQDEADEENLYGEKEEGEEEAETAEEANQRFTVYADIRNKLIAQGIQPEQIAFIHDAKTDAQKVNLFQKVNRGDVRVLIGSTEKMGAGMNVQERLIAIHHLDAPWRPRDMGQRNGRIQRQGNQLWNEKQIPIRLYRYMTEGSFDAFMWETLAAKAGPIEQLMEGDPNVDEVEELSPNVLSYEQAKAASSGSPLVREKIILDQDIHKLNVMRGSWLQEQAAVGQQLATLPGQLQAEREEIARLEQDIATRDAHPALVVHGESYTDKDIRAKGAPALTAMLAALGTIHDRTPVPASYRGFALEAIPDAQLLEIVQGDGWEQAREKQADGKYMYYAVTAQSPKYATPWGTQAYDRNEMGLVPLAKKAAENAHEMFQDVFAWDVNRRNKHTGVQAGTISVFARPDLQLVAASHTLRVNVNYDHPAGTIASAQDKMDFERQLIGARERLGRLEKQEIELRSKAGVPFQHEERWNQLRHRQAELAEQLGEDSNDTAALRAADPHDSQNPLSPLLQDPTASLHARWFPSLKYFGPSGRRGDRNVIKGHRITKELAVHEIGNRKKGDTQWVVDHIATGMPVGPRFDRDFDAVAFARQAARQFAWDWSQPPAGFTEKFKQWAHTFQPPTQTPEESKARLQPATPAPAAHPAAEADQDEASGPQIERESALDKDKPQFQRAVAPGFYSQLARAIEQKMPAKAAVPQVLAILDNPQNGVKPDEIKWTGIQDWLTQQKGPVTKQAVLDFVRANAVEVHEVSFGTTVNRAEVERLTNELAAERERLRASEGVSVKEGDKVATVGSAPSRGGYSYSTGKIYEATRNADGRLTWKLAGEFGGTRSGRSDKFVRELKESAPYPWMNHVSHGQLANGSAAIASHVDRIQIQLDRAKQGTGTPTTYGKYTLPGRREYHELLLMLPNFRSIYDPAQGVYRSGHWKEPNVVAHVRFDTRESPDGKRVLLIEEIQSDWHEAGRKGGYWPEPTTPLKAAHPASGEQSIWEVTTEDGRFVTNVIQHGITEEEAIAEARRRARENPRRIAGVPPAPFSKTWHELVFRRMLRWAAENGFDRLAWTTGDQQAARYDLSRQVSGIAWQPSTGELYVRKKGSEKYEAAPIAKDVTAQNIVEYVGKDTASRLAASPVNENGYHELTGSKLKVGGNGMKVFYDQMVPQYASKYGKKWGARVEDTKIVTGATQRTVHSIDITPAMRESVLAGQPLFQRAPLAAPDPAVHYQPPSGSTPGVIFVNTPTGEALAAVWNDSHIPAMKLEPRHAAYAAQALRAAHPELAAALEESVRDNGYAIVVTYDRPEEEVIHSVRHELWHALIASLGHLGPLENALLDHPLAQKAMVALTALGYQPREMSAEIGAFLAARQWARLGLTADQAGELGHHYLTLVAQRFGPSKTNRAHQALREATLKAKEALDARRPRQAADVSPAQRSAGGIEQGAPGLPAGERSGPRAATARSAAEGPTGGEPGADLPAFQRGTAPGFLARLKDNAEPLRLTNIAHFLRQKFGEREGYVNYYGIGAHRRFLPGSNLKQIEHASPATHTQALRAAGARGEANAIMHASMPAIAAALQGSGVSFDELRLAYIESRLRGLRDRWNDFAQQSRTMDDQNLEQAFTHEFASLLDNIEDKRGMFPDVVQAAAALHTARDWDGLRDFLATTFEDAARAVYEEMPGPWFDRVADAIHNHPQVAQAHAIYKHQVEAAMAESHAENEGVFSTALGPLDTYYPLIPVNRRPSAGGATSVTPFRAPTNPHNQFATGLSEGYDPGLPAFREALARALRANSRAALIHTAEQAGLIQRDVRGSQPLVTYQGKRYQAERTQIGQPRTLIQNGKVTHLPARMVLIPKFAYREMEQLLSSRPMDPDDLDRLAQFLNVQTLLGPAEFAFHSIGLLGALVANTPFLGASLGDKALSFPLVKRIGSLVKVLSDDCDPAKPENAAILVELAKLGALPAKFGTVTYSKDYARETGARRARASFTPLLYGPRGLDARARILMWKIAQADKPNARPQYYYHFVNQLGNYTDELQGTVERILKGSGAGPFVTAGMTRLVNGVMAVGGMGFNARGRVSWDWRLTAALAGFLALYVITYETLTGKLPWNDPRFRFLQIPVGGGHGWIDQYRHSAIGNALWNKGPEVGYLGYGLAFNPLVVRGMRALGAAGAIETRIAGGDTEQVVDAMIKDWLNTYSHAALGPIPRMLIGGLGWQPYLNDLRDRNGQFGPQVSSSVPNQLKPGWFGGATPGLAPGTPRPHPDFWANTGARMAAAVEQLNSFGANLGEATGLLGEYDHPRGNPWLRNGANLMLAPLLGEPIANPSNPYKRNQYLRQQRGGD